MSPATPELCSEAVDGVTRNIVCLFREPDAGNPPVRFDEREQETEPCQTGLRRRRESFVSSHRETTVTAPVLDSTPARSCRQLLQWRNSSCCGCRALPRRRSGRRILPRTLGSRPVVVVIASRVGEEPLGIHVVVFVHDVGFQRAPVGPQKLELVSGGCRAGGDDEVDLRTFRFESRRE